MIFGEHLVGAPVTFIVGRLRNDLAMNRRKFIGTIACSHAAVPLIAEAQNVRVLRRIGWLGAGKPPSTTEFERRYSQLSVLGWVEGKNLVIERRYGSVDLLPRWAEDFVRLKVDLIVADGTAAAQATKSVTTTIPIVMWSVGDPVTAGLVASLRSPGGNITGYALLAPEIDGKRLSLLREILPMIQRVGELFDSNNPYSRASPIRLKGVYQSLGMQPIFVDLVKVARLEDSVAEAKRQQAQALHVPYADPFDDTAMQRIMHAALEHMLPTIVDTDELLDAGGLLSYAVNDAEAARRGAVFVDKILRGAKPSDLPVEQPTKFDLGINLRTARTLKVMVPQRLLLSADRIVQ